MSILNSKNVEYFKQLLYDHEGLYYYEDDDYNHVIYKRVGNKDVVLYSEPFEDELFYWLEDNCKDFYTVFKTDDVLNPVLFVCQP